MHNPRGSNDRNCERNVNRNNGNRLFDSQNNAKGGYACPRAVGDETVQNEDGIANLAGHKQDKKIYYYEGSFLPIEWTNQHGCGRNSKQNCEIVIQYMCEDTADPAVKNFWPYTDYQNCGANPQNCGKQAFRSSPRNMAAPRDGIPTDALDEATDTIGDDILSATPNTTATRRYGMHESFNFYDLCKHTERNRGLYTADQRVRRNDQRGTRQNPNGDRRGLECPEERDYYPWWMPAPWVDIAVLTNDAENKTCTDPSQPECTARCKFYLENSFNKNRKGYCDVKHDGSQPASLKTSSAKWNQNSWYNNKGACVAAGFEWYTISLSDVLQLDYPVCARTGFSRVNQLGNSFEAVVDSDALHEAPHGLNANRYMWKIPQVPKVAAATTEAAYFPATVAAAYQSCSLRIRYNLSSSDFPSWPPDAMVKTHPWRHEMVTSKNNSVNGDYSRTPLTQDPYVYIGAGDQNKDDDTADRSGTGDEKFVSLAVNTNQYARTFQDRSYKFAIRPLPTAHATFDDGADTPIVPKVGLNEKKQPAKIFNVNVRGKRGNIVQTYPAVEYDFIPNALALTQGDMIHWQWTGSDYNPRRGCNDAEGGPPDPNDFVSGANQDARADRSNVIFKDMMADNTPMEYVSYQPYKSGSKVADSLKGTQAYAAKVDDMHDLLYNKTPCSVGHADCFEAVMRLAYLNQESDLGSLGLRRGRPCLNQYELDQIPDMITRETHPLNCAKLNAKPYPYFDGGLMRVDVPGKFAFFSSRNNNFSNRDQSGVVCVKGEVKRHGQQVFVETCEADRATGVLQDVNLALETHLQEKTARLTARAAAKAAAYAQGPHLSAAPCIDQANTLVAGSANDQGAASCLTAQSNTKSDLLTSQTFTVEQAANDEKGDGDKRSCQQMNWFDTVGDAFTANSFLGLAIALAFVGFAAAWASLYCYNRIAARRAALKDTGFAGTTKWKKLTNDDSALI
jgi:hypothetical protein